MRTSEPRVAVELPGLHKKFRVRRADGRDKPGGDRDQARYFVLDYVHDEAARQALLTYANFVERGNPQLARDLYRELADTAERDEWR